MCQIENDYKVLELRCFSDASDEELLALTTTFLGQQHLEPLKRCRTAFQRDDLLPGVLG